MLEWIHWIVNTLRAGATQSSILQRRTDSLITRTIGRLQSTQTPSLWPVHDVQTKLSLSLRLSLGHWQFADVRVDADFTQPPSPGRFHMTSSSLFTASHGSRVSFALSIWYDMTQRQIHFRYCSSLHSHMKQSLRYSEPTTKCRLWVILQRDHFFGIFE